MKHFNNVTSLEDLKKQYRKLALANHPDKGGRTEVMQEINVEFDVLFKIWKDRVNDNDEQPTSETASEYRRNFYTANGWEGSRYDCNLSTKDIAARVREYVKIQWPGWKFSVRCKYASMCSEIMVSLKGGPVTNPLSSEGIKKGYRNPQISYMTEENDLLHELVNVVMIDVNAYIDSFRYDDSDGMIDYFDTNFYKFVEVRSSDWEEIHKTARVKEANKGLTVSEETRETAVETVEGLEIVDYSEKAVAVFGDTKAIKDELKSIGGKFNPRLNYNGGKRAGWVFPKSKLGELDKFIHDTGTNDTITALENDNKTIIEQPNDKEERTPMNPADFMAFASYVQNIAINEGYIHARNHVKEKLKRYRNGIAQLKYIIFLLSEYRERNGHDIITGAA